jgi:hypothetical protein
VDQRGHRGVWPDSDPGEGPIVPNSTASPTDFYEADWAFISTTAATDLPQDASQVLGLEFRFLRFFTTPSST